MKMSGYTFTADQATMFVRLQAGQTVQATMPNGGTVELRPIPHYNSLDWGFAVFFNGKAIGREYSVEDPELFAKTLTQLHLA